MIAAMGTLGGFIPGSPGAGNLSTEQAAAIQRSVRQYDAVPSPLPPPATVFFYKEANKLGGAFFRVNDSGTSAFEVSLGGAATPPFDDSHLLRIDGTAELSATWDAGDFGARIGGPSAIGGAAIDPGYSLVVGATAANLFRVHSNGNIDCSNGHLGVNTDAHDAYPIDVLQSTDSINGGRFWGDRAGAIQWVFLNQGGGLSRIIAKSSGGSGSNDGDAGFLGQTGSPTVISWFLGAASNGRAIISNNTYADMTRSVLQGEPTTFEMAFGHRCEPIAGKAVALGNGTFMDALTVDALTGMVDVREINLYGRVHRPATNVGDAGFTFVASTEQSAVRMSPATADQNCNLHASPNDGCEQFVMNAGTSGFNVVVQDVTPRNVTPAVTHTLTDGQAATFRYSASADVWDLISRNY